MKNIVSFKTAQLLKKYAFPQPDPTPGQFWYNNFGHLFLISGLDPDSDKRNAFITFNITAQIGQKTIVEPEMMNNCFFAASADDILHLFHGAYLEYDGLAACCIHRSAKSIDVSFAEAAAKVWVSFCAEHMDSILEPR